MSRRYLIPALLVIIAGIFLLLPPASTFIHPRLIDAEAQLSGASAKIRIREGDPSASSRRQVAIDLAAERWYQEILAQNPDFHIEFKKVADKDNGFLQLLAMMEEFKDTPVLPDDIRSMLDGSKPWDPAAFQAWKDQNVELFDRILAVAELPDQSSAGIPFSSYSFLHVRLPKTFSDILLANVRLSLESGDVDAALRSYKATFQLANHIDQIETPNLLQKTVAVLIRNQAISRFSEQILPTLPTDSPSIDPWQSAMAWPEEFSTEWSRLMTAEWHSVLRVHLLPALLTGNADDIAPGLDSNLDENEAIQAYTAGIRQIRSTSAEPPLQWLDNPPPPPAAPEGSGAAVQELNDTLFMGSSHWSKGLISAHVSLAMQQAAIALQTGKEAPLEPITGKPFVWDPTHRTLSLPEAALDLGLSVKPLQLP